jgi:hypothetical protein
MEQHFAQIALGESIRGFRRNQATVHGALANARVVDAAAVVFDLDVNVVAAVIGTKHYVTLSGFTFGQAIGGRFDAVSDGVANKVNERIGNLLDDVVV